MVWENNGLGESRCGGVTIWGLLSGFVGIKVWRRQVLGVSRSGECPDLGVIPAPRRGCGSELGSPGARPAAPVINVGN